MATKTMITIAAISRVPPTAAGMAITKMLTPLLFVAVGDVGVGVAAAGVTIAEPGTTFNPLEDNAVLEGSFIIFCRDSARESGDKSEPEFPAKSAITALYRLSLLREAMSIDNSCRRSTLIFPAAARGGSSVSLVGCVSERS